jgi:hypothetical protein
MQRPDFFSLRDQNQVLHAVGGNNKSLSICPLMFLSPLN